MSAIWNYFFTKKSVEAASDEADNLYKISCHDPSDEELR